MKHKKLTALVLCFTMLFSITSGIFSAVFAADSTTDSAYHLDTTTGSGVWSSTTESAYKADNGLKLFSTKKTVTTESSIKTTGREILMNLTSYGDYTTNEASEQRIINRDGIEFYGSLENLEAVPATFVSGVEGLQIVVTSKTIFENKNNEVTYVLCGYKYVGDNQKFKEVAANYPYIPEQYTLEIVANHDMIGKTVAFKNATALLYDNINGYAVGIDGTKLGNMVVEAVMVDGNATWYYVNTVDTAWPEDYPGYHCVKATDVKVVEEEEDETPTSPCPICGVANCTTAHLYCDICGEFDCGEKHEKQEPVRPATTPVIPTNPTLTEGANVSIVDEYGDAVTEDGFILAPGMRSSLSAWSYLEDEGNVSYQWQICYDTANKLWVDIQRQTGKGMLISPAMVMSIIETEGTALIRCEVTLGNIVKYSAEIPVTVADDTSAMARFALPRTASNDAALPLTENDGSENQKKIYVVVNYEFSDGRTAAASDFAEIIPGVAYSHTYPLPDVVGYKATLETHSYDESAKIVKNSTTEKEELVLNFAAGVLTDNYTIFTIQYVPDFVDVTVIHDWQNTDNDYYKEHESENLSDKYKTGDLITEVHKSYNGFYNLLYETPTAAADGSTVIRVYYDRYYYLMTFDLGENGYGVDPIYTRYGDTLEIGTPTRQGYTFQGWKLNGTGDTIDAADMPTTMPYENREYVAQWQEADEAKVSVVFWGENPNDNGYSYVDTKEIYVKPGISYTFSEDGGLICGYHEHDAECYELTCQETSHNHATDGCTLNCNHTTHTLACYGNPSTTSGVTSDDAAAVKNVGTGNPQSGYLYVIKYNWDYREYKYFYFEGKWYAGGNLTIDGDAVGTGIYEKNNLQQWTATKYAVKCNHTHTNACYTCGKINGTHTHTDYTGKCYTPICTETTHTHTSSCYDTLTGLESSKWTFKSSETVTVDASGTSVVNVYYDRATFTLTFKKSGTTVKTITDKWGADIHSQFPIKEGNQTMWWTVPNGCSSMNPGTEFGSLDTMPAESITFTYDDKTNAATLHYYIEALPSDGGKTALEIYNGFTNANYSGIDSTKKFISYKDINVQTSGYLTYTEEFHNIIGFRQYVSYPKFNKHELGGKTGDIKTNNYLLYARNAFAIEFYNPTELIKTQANVPYQMPLSDYDWTPTANQAPAIYEPGSVQFAGWYLNPNCSGQQFDFTQNTMPAGPNNVNGEVALALYAKWEPVEYKVNYYLTRDSLTNSKNIPTEMKDLVDAYVSTGGARPATDPYTEVFAEDIVKHGAYISNLSNPNVSEGYANIHPRAGYTFIGWFYLNEKGEETAFDPENMPVQQHLNLYGKWSADKLCKYNVYFALDKDNNGIADVDENGNIIYIAESVSGSGIAGRTYTFTAKGGEELDAAYSEGYFPTVGSHSIEIDIADEEGTGTNSVIFLYQEKEAVPYTVKYLEKGTDKVLATQKYVKDNKNIVVTENFVYIQGYMPDEYQKTLVITVGGTNEIIFYYTKDEKHSLYVVNHYIQELDENLKHKGWIKYTDLQNTGDIDKTYTADAIAIDGFTLSAYYTDKYNITDKKNGMTGTALPTLPISALTDEKLSGTLTDKGMELNFYYTRNLYPYEFRYWLNGTTIKLAPNEIGMAGYDMVVTEAAKEITMDLDGDGINEDYRLYDPTETTKDIQIKKDGDPLSSDATVSDGQAKINVAIFYYVRCTQTMTITKNVVDNCDWSNPNLDQEFTFSLLIHAKDGYHKNSYDFTKSDGTTGTLSPELIAPNTLQFTLKHGETITIEGLPTAEYTVTELNLPAGYTDSYSPAQRNTLTVDRKLDVTVTNTYAPAQLTIKKTVEGTGFPENSEFTFKVVFGDGNAYGYTKDGVAGTLTTDGTLTLKAGESAVFAELPVGITYTVEETVSPASFTQKSANGTSGTTAVDGKHEAKFVNKYQPAKLTITKEVQSADTAPNVDFTFTVVFSDNGTYAYTKNGGTTTTNLASGDTLTLKAGESAVFANLPVGITYTVTETAIPASFTQQSAENTTGTTALAGEYTATFVNKYEPAQLTISKTVTPEGTYSFLSDAVFTFQVTFSDGGSYAYTKDGGTTTTNLASGGTLTLKAGESATFAELPVGITYTVKETGIPAAFTQDTANTTGTSGTTVHSGKHEAKFVNKYEPAQLLIRKTVTPAGNYTLLSNAVFTFQVIFENGPAGASYAYSKSDGTTGSLTSGGTLTLKASQTAAFTELPVGVTYTVTETNIPAAFTQDIDATTGTTGTTERGGKYQATFVNVYAPATLTISKAVVSSGSYDAPEGAVFTFKVTFSDGGTYAYTKDGGTTTTNLASGETLTLQAGQTATFTELPVGVRYTVSEQNLPMYFTQTASSGVTEQTVRGEVYTAKFTNTYTLPEIGYTVRYLEYGTDKVLADPVTGTGLVTQTATETAKDIPFYTLVGEEITKTMTLVADTTKNVITFYYTRDTGSLKVTKELSTEGNATVTVENFYFYITVPADVTGEYTYTVGEDSRKVTVTDGKMTINIQAGQTAEFASLPAGEYTVAERDYSSEGYSTTYVDNSGSDITDGVVTVTKNATVTVTCKNAFPFGSIVITKKADKAYANDTWETDTFEFTIVCTSKGLTPNAAYPVYHGTTRLANDAVVNSEGKLVVTLTFNEPGTQTIKVDDLPQGVYTVTETPDAAYTQTATNSSSLTVETSISPQDYSGEVEFTNTLNRYAGGLQITKNLTVIGSAKETVTDFYFDITVPADVTGKYTYTVGAESREVTVTDGKLTINIKAGQTAVITDLPIGIYTVAEHDYTDKGYSATYDDNSEVVTDGIVNLTNGGTATVICNNKFPMGSITISKTVTKAYGNDVFPGDTFTFTIDHTTDGTLVENAVYAVYNADGTEKLYDATVQNGVLPVTITFSSAELGTTKAIKIDGLPQGSYTVEEAVDSAYIQKAVNSSSLTVETSIYPEDYTGTAAFENVYKKYLGDLTITKSGSQAIDENQSFIFDVEGVTGTDTAGYSMTVVIHGDNSVTIKDLQPGEYTVTEQTNWSWRYNPDSATKSVTLTAGETETVPYANSRSTEKVKWLDGGAWCDNLFKAEYANISDVVDKSPNSSDSVTPPEQVAVLNKDEEDTGNQDE